MAKSNRSKKSRKKRTGRGLPASVRKSLDKKKTPEKKGAVFHATSTAVFDQFVEDEQPMVVDFWAKWGGPCKAMSPTFDKVAAEFEGQVRFVKVNTEKVPQLSEAFGIRSIPTLIVMNGDEVTDSTVGLTQEANLRKMAQKALDRASGVTVTDKLKRWFGGGAAVA